MASRRTKLATGFRDPLVLVPGNLEEAKELFTKFPPKKVRQCHGCHGFNDQDHDTIPLGASKCPLPHDSRCMGGILAGKDSKGKEWRACGAPVGRPDDDDNDEITDSELDDASDEELLDSAEEDSYPATSSRTDTMVIGSPPMVSGAGSLPPFIQSTSVFGTTTTVSSSQRTPLLSTPQPRMSEQEDELAAALQQLRLERENLEEQARKQQQQQQSAKRVELQRQVQAEKDRIKQLKKSNKQVKLNPPVGPNFTDNLRQQNQVGSFQTNFQSFYEGPNIKEIRKTKGLRNGVEDVVDNIRTDNPSLGRRPTAGSHVAPTQTHTSKSLGARPKVAPEASTATMFKEFEQFMAWKQGQVTIASDSESDATPPKAAAQHKRMGQKRVINGDPYTTHSTYKGPYPFQSGPMQKYYRILTSMDPMNFLLLVI